MARRAGLLLVLIVGHLVMMATPVHTGALVHAGPSAVASRQQGQHAIAPQQHVQHVVPVGLSPLALRASPAAAAPADCAFEPAPPPGGPSARSLAAQGASVPLWLPSSPLSSVGPAACATGPPIVLLSQPFLQVFRT